MTRFSEDDKIRLYIVRAAAKELKDGLTYQYTSLMKKRSKSNSKVKDKARTAAWDATWKQVRKRLLEKKGAPWDDPMPHSGQVKSDGSGEVVCPAPKRKLALPLTGWSGANAQVDIGDHAAFFPQQDALSEEQRWATGDSVSNAALWPEQVAEYPFASSTANGLDAALMHRAVNGAVGNVPTYGGDSSATYSAGDWARCGADNPCPYGAGGPVMYEAGMYMHGDSSYVYEDGTCMYGTGVTYMDAASSLGAYETDSTAGTTIGSGLSLSHDRAVESYSTATTTPMIVPGNRSGYDTNGPAAGTSSYTAGSLVDHTPIATGSPSEHPLSGHVAPASTYPQGLNVESMSIMDTFTGQEAVVGLMSSEDLYLLLERCEAGSDVI